jgi:hypothetical protein
MAKALPKKLFVKVEKEGSTEYFVADADAANLIEMGEKIKIGVYQLVEVQTAEGVAKFSGGKNR